MRGDILRHVAYSKLEVFQQLVPKWEEFRQGVDNGERELAELENKVKM